MRAVEHLRLIAGELQIADVRAQLSFFIASDFEGHTTLAAGPQHDAQLATMLDQVVAWSGALRSVRAGELAAAA